MNQQSNFLYFMVGVLAVAVGVLAYTYLADDGPGSIPARESASGTSEFNLNVGDDDGGAEGSFENETTSEGIEE